MQLPGNVLNVVRSVRFQAVVLGALSMLVFWPVLSGLVQEWRTNDAFSHAAVVPLVVAYLVWKKRDDIRSASLVPWRGSMLLLCSSLLLYVVSSWGGLLIGQRIALVAFINAAVLYHAGRAVHRTIRFPLLALVLALPAPVTLTGSLSWPLRSMATQASHAGLRLLSIPVIREGNILRLPAGSLEVAEACSGLGSMALFTTIAVFAAWAIGGSLTRKILTVLSGFAAAVLFNIMRITVTALLVHRVGIRMADGTSHEIIGAAILAAGLVAYVATLRAASTAAEVSA
jgi:exosortase